jgi:cytochrome c551/c552
MAFNGMPCVSCHRSRAASTTVGGSFRAIAADDKNNFEVAEF